MKSILSKMKWVLMGVLCVMCLIGCSQSNGEIKVEDSVNSTSQAKSGDPIEIVDSYGKVITLEQEPERIISLAPNITEIIYAIGAEDKLVGRTNYCDYPAQVSEVESVGDIYPPDIEKIISLEPDLVITSTHFSEEETLKLEQLGIKVVGLFEEFKVEGVYSIIDTLGCALNKQAEATKVIKEMKESIESTHQKVADEDRPSVYYVVSYGEYGDFSAPENSYVGGLIQLAGGQNIMPIADNWYYSLEALLEADPEVIIIRKGDKEGFMAAEGYKNLTAVKEGKVFEIDSNLLDRQSYRNAEGVLALAKIMHPEVFEA